MKPETLAALTRQAEETYPVPQGIYIPDAVKLHIQKKQQSFIDGATPWIEKLEMIRAEVEERKNEMFSRSFKTENLALEANGAFNEASEILSIIDKHTAIT